MNISSLLIRTDIIFYILAVIFFCAFCVYLLVYLLNEKKKKSNFQSKSWTIESAKKFLESNNINIKESSNEKANEEEKTKAMIRKAKENQSQKVNSNSLNNAIQNKEDLNKEKKEEPQNTDNKQSKTSEQEEKAKEPESKQALKPKTDSKTDKTISILEQISTGKDEQTEIANRITIKNLICELNDKEKEIILLRYYKQKTQMQVSKILGITQVQVSRIERKVLEKMKKKLIS